MTDAFDEIERKAAVVGFTLKRGSRTGAGYVLIHDGTDEKPLGDNFTASLKRIDKYLEDRLREMAGGFDLRLTKAKHAQQLHDLSSGEARASQQHQATAGYMIEAKEVVIDKGLRGDDRKEREAARTLFGSRFLAQIILRRSRKSRTI
jgi:hypothetical protein